MATDAIGMGLNMDVNHVAFSSLVKFDGWAPRKLYPAELAQIAGRAGRYMSDGTFGTTGELGALEPELVSAIEDHRFEPLNILYWRNVDLRLPLARRACAQPRDPAPGPFLRRATRADFQALQHLRATATSHPWSRPRRPCACSGKSARSRTSARS